MVDRNLPRAGEEFYLIGNKILRDLKDLSNKILEYLIGNKIFYGKL